MYDYVGSIVDLLATTTPGALLADYGPTFVWMGFVIVVARPVMIILQQLLIDQTLVPSFTNLVRWQNHRYVLRQSVGFFADDFAGRIASKIVQTGPALRESVVQVCEAVWFVSIYAVSALVLFGEIDWRLTLPLAGWVAIFVGDPRLFRAAHPRPLDHCLGGALGDDRASGRQLHQHPDGEALRPCGAGGRLHPRGDDRPHRKTPPRDPDDHADERRGGDLERPAYRRHHGARDLAVVAGRPDARRDRADQRPHHPHLDHVRLDHVDRDQRLRVNGHRAGGPRDHRAAEPARSMHPAPGNSWSNAARSASTASASITAATTA